MHLAVQRRHLALQRVVVRQRGVQLFCCVGLCCFGVFDTGGCTHRAHAGEKKHTKKQAHRCSSAEPSAAAPPTASSSAALAASYAHQRATRGIGASRSASKLCVFVFLLLLCWCWFVGVFCSVSGSVRSAARTRNNTRPQQKNSTHTTSPPRPRATPFLWPPPLPRPQRRRSICAASPAVPGTASNNPSGSCALLTSRLCVTIRRPTAPTWMPCRASSSNWSNQLL